MASATLFAVLQRTMSDREIGTLIRLGLLNSTIDTMYPLFIKMEDLRTSQNEQSMPLVLQCMITCCGTLADSFMCPADADDSPSGRNNGMGTRHSPTEMVQRIMFPWSGVLPPLEETASSILAVHNVWRLFGPAEEHISASSTSRFQSSYELLGNDEGGRTPFDRSLSIQDQRVLNEDEDVAYWEFSNFAWNLEDIRLATLHALGGEPGEIRVILLDQLEEEVNSCLDNHELFSAELPLLD